MWTFQTGYKIEFVILQKKPGQNPTSGWLERASYCDCATILAKVTKMFLEQKVWLAAQNEIFHFEAR